MKKTIFFLFLFFWLAFFSSLFAWGVDFLNPPKGQVNFLVLGVGGENHTAADLTDTIMFASLNQQTGEVVLVSLPRDIWVDELKTKLNSVYHYQGIEGVEREVTAILDQPVNYYFLIDFNGVVEIIDLLGGVEVSVERAFDDYRFPLPGKENDLCGGDLDFNCRYEHIRFDQGRQLMNGSVALKYIRSRNAEGEEGTDFARGKRQQNLIAALKEKILDPYWLIHPRQAKETYDIAWTAIETNFPQEKYLDLFKTFLVALKIPPKVETITLDDQYLYPPKPGPTTNNQWALLFNPDGLEAFRQKLKEAISF